MKENLPNRIRKAVTSGSCRCRQRNCVKNHMFLTYYVCAITQKKVRLGTQIACVMWNWAILTNTRGDEGGDWQNESKFDKKAPKFDKGVLKFEKKVPTI